MFGTASANRGGGALIAVGRRAVGKPPGGWEFSSGDGPIVAAAVHAGHDVRPDAEGFMAAAEHLRRKEEDPCTGEWTRIAPNRIVVRTSRFEVDLNRPPERAVYRTPAEAWGITVWRQEPSREFVQRSLALHEAFYRQLDGYLEGLCRRYGTVVVLDLHAFCRRKRASGDDGGKPDFDIGTRTLDRTRWGRLVERLVEELGGARCAGRAFRVTENAIFGGGYFPGWINERFAERVACITVEVKKFFMDEETGEVFPDVLSGVESALRAVVSGLSDEISRQVGEPQRRPAVSGGGGSPA